MIRGIGKVLSILAIVLGASRQMEKASHTYNVNQQTGTYAGIKHRSQAKQRLLRRRHNLY